MANRRTTFDLTPDFLAEGGAARVAIDGTTDADVLSAIVSDEPFPARAEGKIELGHIGLQVENGRDVRFDGGQTVVSFSASGGARSALGIYDRAAEALEALALDTPDGFGLELPDNDASRHMLMSWGYTVEGSASGSHPLGALGALSFDAEANKESLYAIVHSFDGESGARSVIQRTLESWKLPRHVRNATDLPPRTWILAEVDGSLALELGAGVGYDFSFLRDASGLGLTGDIGLKIQAGARATFGLDVSGKYLVVLGRESADTTCRLRLFKLSRKGFSFGQNLGVAVRGEVASLPENVDDLVKAVFGVHGQQVIEDLHVIESWTSPETDLSDTVARLGLDTGLDLLAKSTGIDPRAAFEEAREMLSSALAQWDRLPDRVSAMLWSSLGELDEPRARERFEAFLRAIASEDPSVRRQKLEDALGSIDFPETLEGKLLEAAAENGVLLLIEETEPLPEIAAEILRILDGGVIRELQKFIEERLDLEKLRTIAASDFGQLDSWLVSRISDFLDAHLNLENLEEVQVAIDAVLQKRHEIYQKARGALQRRYNFDLAHHYQQATTRTALIDVELDLSEDRARALFGRLLDNEGYGPLFFEPLESVRLHTAVLTHQLARRSSVAVDIPYFSARSETLNESLARVRAEDEDGRVVFYELDAKDRFSRKNRWMSQLSVSAEIPFEASSAVRRHGAPRYTWSYELRRVQEGSSREEVESGLRPWIDHYLPDAFGGGASSFATWLAAIDREAEVRLRNGPNELGDVLTALELSVPGKVLGAWFRPRSPEEVRRLTMDVSRRLQRALKDYIAHGYFQDAGKFQNLGAAAPLLLYSAIRPTSSVAVDQGNVQWNRDRDVHWDWRDAEVLEAVVNSQDTTRRLAVEMARAEARLLAHGERASARFYEPSARNIQALRETALDRGGHPLGQLDSLLIVEGDVVRGAARALGKLSAFHAAGDSDPKEALEALAKFGAELTETFNKVRSVYGGAALRALGSMVFIEASCAMDPAARQLTPNAMLRLLVLKEDRQFEPGAFLENAWPTSEDVAVQQSLVRHDLSSD